MITKLIKRCIMEYPSLYANALEVLDQLLLTIGGGYSWVNGEICYCISNELDDIDPLEAVKKVIERDEDTLLAIIPRAWNKPKEMCEKIISGFLFNSDNRKIRDIMRIKEADKRAVDYSLETIDSEWSGVIVDDKYAFHIYDSSNIMNLPDNITPEWLDAVETLFNVMKNNEDRVKCGKDYLQKIEKRIKELRK